MSSVVFFANGFGDALISRPALAALAKALPAPASLVCNKGPHEFIFDGLGYAVRATAMQPRPIGRSFDIDQVVESLGRCEVFVDLVPWSSGLVPELGRRLKAERSIGFSPEYGQVVARDSARNAVELAFDVPLVINPELRLADHRVKPAFSAKAQRAAIQVRSWMHRVGCRRLLAVQADTFPHKLWSAYGFRCVLSGVLDQWPDLACVVVGSQPPPLVLEAFAGRMLVLESYSLESSMAVVSSADLFLGIDSCMLHMADLAGVPGVGLFGPTDPAEWGYFWTPACHLRFDGRDDLSIVDAVVNDLSQLMRRSGEADHASGR